MRGREEGQTPEGPQRDGAAANEDRRLAEDPDVLLDVPVLNVEEIDLEVQDLRAHVSVRAEVADLVKINVGVDAYLETVKLGIKGVEAQALLRVKLERILGTIERTMDAIDRNPQILGGALSGAGRAVGELGEGAGSAAQDTGQGVDRVTESAGETAQGATDARQTEDATDEAVPEAPEDSPGGRLLSQSTDEAGRTVRRAVDESGNVVETTVDDSGEVVEEGVTANLDSLTVEEERIDESGRIVGRARDEAGNVVEEILDDEGNVLDVRVVEEAGGTEDGGTGAARVNATPSARERARDLGVDLEGVRGTGSGGRILIKDVEKAARDSVDATPSAKEKARALGVDLLDVTGSGSGGRVTVKDVVRASKEA